MARLTETHKRFIVQQLACFVAPAEVRAQLQEQFGVKASPRQVAYYDPANRSAAELSPALRDLFDRTRSRFISDTSEIAISHRAYRLQELDRLYRKNKSNARENVPLSKELIIEAEKLCGGLYSNRRELTGKDGAPLLPGPNFDDMDDDELRELALRMAGVSEKDSLELVPFE